MADVVPYLAVAAFAALWLVAAVAWFYAAYYMIKLMSRFHPNRTWGRFVPISLFIPWFFTEEGNGYRLKLLKASGVFIAIVLFMLAVGFFSGALNSGSRIPQEADRKVSSNPAFEATLASALARASSVASTLRWVA